MFPYVEETEEGRVKLTLPRMALKADGQIGSSAGEKWGSGKLILDSNIGDMLPLVLGVNEKDSMLRKFFFNLFILTGVCITSLLGSDCEMCYPNCLGSGFLIGGYATFHIFKFHTKDEAFNDTDNLIAKSLWEYDAFQRAPGGGGFIGYGTPFCEWFNLAFKAAATGFTSDARHSFHDNDSALSYTNKMRVKYIIDLSLELGAKIENRLLLYVKFGASNARLSQTRQIVEENISNVVFGKDKQHYHIWGYVFGSGANVLITRCISAFAEYDWHSYPLNNSKRRVENNDNPADFLEYRLTRLYGYGFRFGLMAQF